jgi:hypothetical protein
VCIQSATAQPVPRAWFIVSLSKGPSALPGVGSEGSHPAGGIDRLCEPSMQYRARHVRSHGGRLTNRPTWGFCFSVLGACGEHCTVRTTRVMRRPTQAFRRVPWTCVGGLFNSALLRLSPGADAPWFWCVRSRCAAPESHPASLITAGSTSETFSWFLWASGRTAPEAPQLSGSFNRWRLP